MDDILGDDNRQGAESGRRMCRRTGTREWERTKNQRSSLLKAEGRGQFQGWLMMFTRAQRLLGSQGDRIEVLTRHQ